MSDKRYALHLDDRQELDLVAISDIAVVLGEEARTIYQRVQHNRELASALNEEQAGRFRGQLELLGIATRVQALSPPQLFQQSFLDTDASPSIGAHTSVSAPPRATARTMPSTIPPNMRLPLALAASCLVIAFVLQLVTAKGIPLSNRSIDFVPIQNPTNIASWTYKDQQITPLASYDISARVLGKKRYRFDGVSELSPFDLALGWKSMSQSDVIEQLTIWQIGRWVYYRRASDQAISLKQAMLNSSTVHIIPANAGVARDIAKLKQHQFIRLQGYLIGISGPDIGFDWRSSLVRTDTGDGACELMWVESVEVLD